MFKKESLLFCKLQSDEIRTLFKPSQKLGDLLCSCMDTIESGHRQGAIQKLQ